MFPKESGDSAKKVLDSVDGRDKVEGGSGSEFPWAVQTVMRNLYCVKDVQRFFGFKPGRIRYWDKIGFLTPSVRIGARKYYTSQDLIGWRTAKGLLDTGLSFAVVKRSVIDVKKISPGVTKLH